MLDTDITRRRFVKGAAAVSALGATALASPGFGFTHRRDDPPLRIGVIGCGGRGTGAAVNALDASANARIVALADLFDDRLNQSREYLSSQSHLAERATVDRDRCYVGFDAYQRLLADGDVDVVLLATPPHFRPIHFEAAINAGMHVFMEKPVAVDPVGVQRVLAAGAVASDRNLCVVAGTQRRHEVSYRRAMRQVGDGAIGRLVSGRCYWNQGGLWVHDRTPEYSDMEWQCRNWLYFTWLSGDHIVEQHMHNLDVINWAAGTHPLRCMGMGGRQVRTGEQYGNIFDHFAVEYDYPDGVHVLSMCRQIDGCATRVEEVLHGTRGRMTLRPGFARIDGGNGWQFDGENPNPYVQELRDLFNAIETGTSVNEARTAAESTLTAIMGRMSAYTGREVTWAQALDSTLDLSPPTYAFGDLPVRPVATPGRTRLE